MRHVKTLTTLSSFSDLCTPRIVVYSLSFNEARGVLDYVRAVLWNRSDVEFCIACVCDKCSGSAAELRPPAVPLSGEQQRRRLLQRISQTGSLHCVRSESVRSELRLISPIDEYLQRNGFVGSIQGAYLEL